MLLAGLKQGGAWNFLLMTSDCLQSAKKEWQAFQSGDSEFDCVSWDFIKYGKALLRSSSQSWRNEMSLLLCRSRGLCCTSSRGVVWFLKIDMGQTSVSSLSERASGKCLEWLVLHSLTRCLLTHTAISINAQGGKTWLFESVSAANQVHYQVWYLHVCFHLIYCYLRDATS